MKWSEQMRELISVDENFNQLMCDVDKNVLYINDKMIAKSDSIGDDGKVLTIQYDKYKEIIKKYPFFSDIKFLLNCIFMFNTGTMITYVKPDFVMKFNNRYEIYNAEVHGKAVIYFK